MTNRTVPQRAPASGQPPRRVLLRGRKYRDLPYKPQFALGLICRSEAEQSELFRKLSGLLPDHDIKVLVI